MKGISLAIETVIFIILAVTVLSVLLLFFVTTGGKSQERAELESQRIRMCADFVQKNPSCKGLTGGVDSKLFSVCKSLDVQECKSSSPNMLLCYQKCCKLYCP